ncbi:MAG: acyl carrier protein [Magnetococcus sp. DMHC-6]
MNKSMDVTTIEKNIKQFLSEEMGVDLAEVGSDGTLFTSGLLDSMDVIRLIEFLETQIKNRISPLDVSLEQFDSLSRIIAFVQHRLR